MSCDKEDPTRRNVIGGAASEAGDVVARCADWIALDLEIDRLAVRWSQLETLMARQFQWFELTHAERRALPEAAEMYEIDAKLTGLSYERERQLEPLSRRKADTLNGVASKLAVAAAVLKHEDSPAHALVAGVVRELAALNCPGCGAAYIPDSTARA